MKNTKEISRKFANILGVRIDSTSKDKVLRQVQANIQRRKKFYITTPNPEHIMMAQEDKLFIEILNSSDISIPDGIGIIAANKFFSLPRPNSIILRFFTLLMQGLGVGFSALFDKDWLESELKLVKGREVFNELIKVANKKGWKVVLVGDKEHSAQKASRKLKAVHLHLKTTSLDGPSLDNNANPRTATDKVVEKKVIEKINKVKPEFVFVGFRAPVQEKWLYRWYDKLDFVGGMVIGGTFDYISGKKELPPKWIEDINLEWLWRLVRGDQKVKRIIKAFPSFAFKVFWHKLVKDN